MQGKWMETNIIILQQNRTLLRICGTIYTLFRGAIPPTGRISINSAGEQWKIIPEECAKLVHKRPKIITAVIAEKAIDSLPIISENWME